MRYPLLVGRRSVTANREYAIAAVGLMPNMCFQLRKWFLRGLVAILILLPACKGPGEAEVESAPPTDAGTTRSVPTSTEPAPKPAVEFTCDNPCHVVLDGDSLTKHLVERLCNKITDLGACYNSGVAGDRVDQMTASAAADVDTHLGNSTNDLLFFWGGTNDLWKQFHDSDPERNAEATVRNIEQYLAERRDAGWDHIVVVNVPEMKSEVRGVDALNQLLASSSFDGFIDLAADPALALGNPNGFRNTDGVHFTPDGSRHIVDTHYIPMVEALRR